MNATDLGQCTAPVTGIGGWYRETCSRKAKAVENDKGYCTQHLPSRIKSAQADRMAKQKIEHDEHWARESYKLAATAWCRKQGMTLEDLKA